MNWYKFVLELCDQGYRRSIFWMLAIETPLGIRLEMRALMGKIRFPEAPPESKIDRVNSVLRAFKDAVKPEDPKAVVEAGLVELFKQLDEILADERQRVAQGRLRGQDINYPFSKEAQLAAAEFRRAKAVAERAKAYDADWPMYLPSKTFVRVVRFCLSDDLFKQLCDIVAYNPKHWDLLPYNQGYLRNVSEWRAGMGRRCIFEAVTALGDAVKHSVAWTEERVLLFEAAYEAALLRVEATDTESVDDLARREAFAAVEDEAADAEAREARRQFIRSFLVLFAQWPLERNHPGAESALKDLYEELSGSRTPHSLGSRGWPKEWGDYPTIETIRDRLAALKAR